MIVGDFDPELLDRILLLSNHNFFFIKLNLE